MNQNKWICLDGDCEFLDLETGEIFYSTPYQDSTMSIVCITIVALAFPVLLSIGLGGF